MKVRNILDELLVTNWWFWASLPMGIGGLVAAMRALYFIVSIREIETSRLHKKDRGIIRRLVSRDIKAMELEMQSAREAIRRAAETMGEDPEIALQTRDGQRALDVRWEIMLNRRRTASTAWAIWAAVQFALASMILGIISLAISLGS